MTPLMIYLLKANGIFILLFLFYQLMLRRDTFYGAKRVFLLGIVLLSVTLPLLPVADLVPQKQSIRYIVVLINDSIPVQTNDSPFQLSTKEWIDLFLMGGIISTAGVLTFRYTMLFRFIRHSAKETILGQEVFVPRKETNPFSFNGRIYLNPGMYDTDELVKIIAHEKAHIDQHHSMDLLAVTFFRLFIWMNPLYYWFTNAVRENIEFLADKKVLQTDNDPKAYQYALLKVAQNSSLSLTQHFNMSHLKKRIIMMNKKQTPTFWSGKYLLACPFLIVVLLLINAPELKAAWANADFSRAEELANPQTTAPADSLKTTVQHKIVIFKQPKDSSNTNMVILIDGKKVSETEAMQIDPNIAHSIDVIKDSVNIDHFKMKSKENVLIVQSKNGKLSATSPDKKVNKTITVTSYKKGTGSSNESLTTIVTDDKDPKHTQTIFVTTKMNQEAPLAIVDGVETENIKDIDRDKIESIDVLKNKETTKIYGEKGKNGVIIITTKKK